MDSNREWEMKPYLVQRMRRREYGAESRTGVDKVFEMDYMGSAEFEFGALPKSLKQMRDAKDTNVRKRLEIETKQGMQVVFYYGPEESAEFAKALFADHLDNKYGSTHRLKERTEIHDAYFGETNTVAWWDIDHHWVAFKTKKLRNAWEKAL